MRETPDVETSSAAYAQRFAGASGRFLLGVQSRAIREALAELSPGSALDVGGGHGQLVEILTAHRWDVVVQGSSSLCGGNLRNVHGKNRVRFVVSDLYALPFPDRSFDVVIAVRLVSHVASVPRLLTEMCRVARRAVILDYPSRYAINGFAPILFGLKRRLERNTRSYASFAPREMTGMFRAEGFRVARAYKQFLLPMALHRAAGGAMPLQRLETAFRSIGVTALFGSPVILRADRREGAEQSP